MTVWDVVLWLCVNRRSSHSSFKCLAPNCVYVTEWNHLFEIQWAVLEKVLVIESAGRRRQDVTSSINVLCVCCLPAAWLGQRHHSCRGSDPREAADRGQRWRLALRGVRERCVLTLSALTGWLRSPVKLFMCMFLLSGVSWCKMRGSLNLFHIVQSVMTLNKN